jgi:hypothetical protein
MTTAEQIQRLEERVQQLEKMVCLAKARCKKCGSTLLILPTTEYLCCECGECFGDADTLLAGAFDEINQLEWISKEGYENQLLMSHLRREVNEKYPRLLARGRTSS